MSDQRPVYIDDVEIAAVQAGAEALVRAGDYDNWVKLAVLALKWKFNGEPVFAELTERETRGVGPSGSEWPPRPRSVNFECHDIDESAGMAEVVELHGYSRKAPGCA